MIRRFLTPAIGDVELADLRRRHINDLVSTLAGEGRARNTIRNVLIPLRSALNAAVDDELIPANPATRIKLPESAPLRKARVPSAEELEKIMRKAKPDAREAIAVVAALGLRRGEVFALRWGDIDFAESIVHVHATNHAAQIQERTKTKAGTRLVPLFLSAAKVLAARQLRLPAHLSRPDSLVFSNAIGGAMDPGNWYRREWAEACKAAGFAYEVGTAKGKKRLRPSFHFHDLRHFAATQLDEQGMSGKLRTEIIGHASEEITNSVYTHVRRERVAAAAQAFDPLAVSR
jgi:integrase